MFHPISKPSGAGFTLLEALFATVLSLVLMGAVFTLFGRLITINQSAANVSDLNQNLRGGADLMVRVLTDAGAVIGVGGISMPGGAGSTSVTWPGPTNVAGCNVFPVYAGALPAINPGIGCGPTIVNGSTTDKLTILSEDQVFLGSPLTTPNTYQVPLSIQTSGATYPVGIAPYPGGCAASPLPPLPMACTGWRVQVTGPTGFNLASGQYQINVGDLIMFNNNHGSTMGMVTAVSAGSSNLITFQNTDPLHLNQPGATTGSPASLANANGSWPPSTVGYRVDMYTYYLSNSGTQPQLMQQYNAATGAPVAVGINGLQFLFDLSDGTAGCAALPWNSNEPTTSACSGGAVSDSPNMIAKVRMTISGVTQPLINSSQHQIFVNSIHTSVTIRDLAFRKQY